MYTLTWTAIIMINFVIVYTDTLPLVSAHSLLAAWSLLYPHTLRSDGAAALTFIQACGRWWSSTFSADIRQHSVIFVTCWLHRKWINGGPYLTYLCLYIYPSLVYGFYEDSCIHWSVLEGVPWRLDNCLSLLAHVPRGLIQSTCVYQLVSWSSYRITAVRRGTKIFRF